ncbi:LuxR family transcriptional regulator [Marinomonas sp. CT5]|uniref:helix-turn-helix domain-containing protein n=1 Tax=Marinomonas sp. CT5 TaxID=2066133 RepID=UPI001840411C|nr:helix-turn-helix transcriptional regulator [Marinomonas sp. CT5]NVK73842.1 helix-turn-helix transcriptional regulator [Oceanospirillaceae bacterium]QUX98006.1 LuxR family transcriptional regulator [Marinomonas sp. CT5]
MMQKNALRGQLALPELMKDLGALTSHIRVPSFPTALEDVLKNLCYFDTIIIVTYKKTLKPLLIHPSNPSEQSHSLRTYLNKAYLLDPLFNAIQQGISPGVYRLIDMAPDSFEETEYYQTCYRNFDLVDEINLLIELDKTTTCAVSLGRQKTVGSIRRTELNNLKNVFPMIEALIKQFWLTQSGEFVNREASSGPLKYALKSFAHGVLTTREQEILGLLLKGHSSKSIANELDISAGTVKVHRKNIHSKLNTSTQSEIFTLFLTHLDALDREKN